MEGEDFTCTHEREINSVNYPFSLDFGPQKIKKHGCWNLRSVRQEKKACFKVNQRLNVWYEHGIGEGRGLTTLGSSYHNTNTTGLLQRLKPNCFSFHPQPSLLEKFIGAGEKEKIKMVNETEIVSQKLIKCFEERRRISVGTAQQLCGKIYFVLYEEKRNATGHKKRAGKYKLSNENLKRNGSTKAIVPVKNECSNSSAISERFFNFLSFQMLLKKDKKMFSQLSNEQTNFLTFDSFSFLEKSRELTEKHAGIYQFFDRNKGDLPVICRALTCSSKYGDKNTPYKYSYDLDNHVRKRYQQQELRESHRFRMRF